MDLATAREHALRAARDQLGEEGSYLPPGGGASRPLRGVLRSPGAVRTVRRGARSVSALELALQSPSFRVLEEDAPTVKGGRLIIGSRSFDVVDLLPMGHALILLVLVEAQASDPAGVTSWR